MHKISQMEKVIPSFQYELLILTLEPKTLNEEKETGQTDGVGPSKTNNRKELAYLKGGRDRSQKEVGGMKYVAEYSLEQLEFVLQEVNSPDYGSATTKIGKQIQIEDHITQEIQEDKIGSTSELQQQEKI